MAHCPQQASHIVGETLPLKLLAIAIVLFQIRQVQLAFDSVLLLDTLGDCSAEMG